MTLGFIGFSVDLLPVQPFSRSGVCLLYTSRRIEEVHPDPAIRQVLEETYQIWKKELQLQLENQ